MKTVSIARPMIESLEPRELFSTTVNLVVSFYGLGGAGGFGNDWMDKITAKAGSSTRSSTKKYDEDQGGVALKDTLRAIDRNHNKRIDKSEINATTLRVIGYSFGGIQAVNFTRDLAKKGAVVKGYTLAAGIPIQSLVTLDPVQSVINNTSGVPSNVNHFGNFYQEKGGDTKVDVYTKSFDVKVYSISVNDPSNIVGGALTSAAHKSRQYRIDQGKFADQTMTHEVVSGFNGKIKGKNVNHGTVPFFAYDWALQDLTA